jgi:hypothetical protein
MVLRRIVEAACDLLGARYGALGVIAPDGSGLEEFIHVGLDDDAAARIESLPRGRACSAPSSTTPLRSACLTSETTCDRLASPKGTHR